MNDIVYRFRSTFEAIFWLEFKNLIYEKIRIPYILNNKKHTYIVDFVDEDNKILYEIKPACLVDDERNIVKFKSAKEWCIKNNYEFKIVTENDITQNLHILNQKDMEIINNNTKLLNSYINFNKRLCNDAYDCLSS